MSFFGKTATVRFVRLAYLDFSYIFPIETTNEPFGLKNINKPVRALGPFHFTCGKQFTLIGKQKNQTGGEGSRWSYVWTDSNSTFSSTFLVVYANNDQIDNVLPGGQAREPTATLPTCT